MGQTRDQEFDEIIPDEETCLKFLRKARKLEGPLRCSNGHEVELPPGTREVRCPHGHRVSITAGTPFEGTRTNLLPYTKALWTVACEPLPFAITPYWLQENSNLTYKAAQEVVQWWLRPMITYYACTKVHGHVEFKVFKGNDLTPKLKRLQDGNFGSVLVVAERKNPGYGDGTTPMVGHMRIELLPPGCSGEVFSSKLEEMVALGVVSNGLPTKIYGEWPKLKAPTTPSKKVIAHLYTTKGYNDVSEDGSRAVNRVWEEFTTWFEQAARSAARTTKKIKTVENYFDEYVFGENLKREYLAAKQAVPQKVEGRNSLRHFTFYQLLRLVMDAEKWTESRRLRYQANAPQKDESAGERAIVTTVLRPQKRT